MLHQVGLERLKGDTHNYGSKDYFAIANWRENQIQKREYFIEVNSIRRHTRRVKKLWGFLARLLASMSRGLPLNEESYNALFQGVMVSNL